MFKKNRTAAVIISISIMIIIAIILIESNGAGFQRTLKSVRSNYGGGLDRTITVYDYNGNEIKSWSGKFDVQESETRVFFDDENGKRVIIYNGIVINEEN
jgi:hypothetical protein